MRTIIKKVTDRIKSINKRYLIISGVLIAVILLALLWYKWPYQEYKNIGMRPDWSVANNIIKAKNSQIFASAVYNLEYTTFLNGEGPFTVFLPSDVGYNDLPIETKALLADTKNEALIRQTVLYHVVKGNYTLADLQDGMKLKTVQGEEIEVTRYNGQVILNGSSYIQTYDIYAKNGVLHAVSGYLTPPSMSGGYTQESETDSNL